MIAVTHPSTVAIFFEAKLRIRATPDFRGCVWAPDHCRGKVMQMSDVVLAIGYNNFVCKVVHGHFYCADPSAVTRSVIRRAFEYAFRDAGVEHILGYINSDNLESLDAARRLGFEEKLVIPNGGEGCDLVLVDMPRDKCRWLK